MNEHVKRPAPLLTRRAASNGAASWDEASRTFRAIIATATPVLRRDWEGPYFEVLDVTGVELVGSVPFLNAHRTGQIGDVIGKVESVERVGDKLEAVIKLSGRDDLAGLARDIADGVVDAVSAGYVVRDWLDETAEDGTRTKTATRWTLVETSAVPIPADPKARIRNKENMTMIDTDPAAPEATPRSRAARIATELEIRGLASIAGLDDAFVSEQVAAGVTLAQARNAVIDAMAERQAPRTNSHIAPRIGAGGLENPEVRAAAMADAIVARALPGFEPSQAARQFVGLTLPELARESLRMANIDTRGMGSSQVIQRALAGHTTSDFAYALSGAVNTVLRRAYTAAPGGLKQVARPITIADFRAQTHVSLSGFSALEKVNEHGEFKRGTIHDGGESVQLATYGKVFSITRQALVNDNIGAFADLPRRLGLAASQFEAEQLAALVVANPVMSDGKTVFHSGHGNLAASGAAPDETTLSAARLALRTQRDEANQLIGLAPKFLIVGPELETGAEKLMAAITAATTDDVQPVRLSIIVEPRITGKAWHVSADPVVADGLVYAHLAGEPGPQLETRQGFDVDGMEFKVRLDFGAAFIDWRSWFKNPGA